jgi:signal transduction histidine kinase/ligand-binding sensor domain-containing protein/CheY-like chemotaxis protein/AraC-like DNA-binding protein
LLLFISVVTDLKAQERCVFSDYLFNSISKEQGLSQSSVLSLLQDHQGFIWMGTKYGLNRYDGYRFVSFKYNPADTNSLQSNEIIQLQLDYNNDLLIGARGGGLNKYIYSNNSFLRIKGIPKHSSVNAIFVDSDSTLWIGSTAGLFRGKAQNGSHNYSFKNVSLNSIFNNSGGTFQPATKQMISVVSIYRESSHSFLIGTEDGVFKFDEANNTFTEIDLAGINAAKVNTILKDNQGKIYIGSSEGIAIIDSSGAQATITYYDIAQPEHRQLKVNWVNQMLIDPNNNIWGGTRGGGLFKIDSQGKLQYFQSNKDSKGFISDNVINSLLIDNTGVLWIGTESRGCNTLDLYRKRFNHIEIETFNRNNHKNQQVTAITGDKKNTLWIGTAFNGINKIEALPNGTFTFENINNISVMSNMPTNEIIALLMDDRQNLWIGMGINSIVKVDKNRNITGIPTAGFVFAIHQDRKGQLWYGTWGNGLGRINREQNTVQSFNTSSANFQTISSDIVVSLTDDSHNNLWIGTKGGGINIAPLNVLNAGQSGFVHYVFVEGDSLSISNNEINCMLEDKNGNLWLGTSNGLNKAIIPEGKTPNEIIYQGKLKFQSFFDSDGLPNNVICGILEDNEGYLWISTMDGLSKFDPVTQTFTNYNANDGLQANEFHTNGFYKKASGELFFGGVNGISAFKPAEIKQNPHLSDVTITVFKVFDTDVKPNQKILNKVLLTEDISGTEQIVLNHKHKEFSFEFSGMHFSNTANVRYMYRLLGFNNEWRFTEANEHSATYTNIFEGDYVFQVKATNNDGVWNDQIAQIKITVLPPFWRTPFFYSIYFFAILILLFFFRKYSLIAATEKTKLKIEALEKKKLAEITESKMRFFTNISHEIRTPLTLIYTPLERVIQQGTLDNESRSSLTLVKKNVSRLLSLTNQLLQLRKIDIGILEPRFEVVNCTTYVKDILGYFENQSKRKAISLTFESDEISESQELWIDKEMITTALYNLLSNAFKYTRINGKIKVRMTKVTARSLGLAQAIKNNKGIESWLQLDVIDNGIGIPAKELNHIFHRFYQSSNSTTTEQAGSGIGLSIVKEYVELHSGKVKATSQEGKGTTIQVFLPLGNVHIAPKQIKDQSVSARPPKAIYETLNALNEPIEDEMEPVSDDSDADVLLLADDDVDMLNFLKNHFSKRYHVVTAINGKEAWQLIQKIQPQLVLSDVMMPGIDGNELCNLVKNTIETSHIPVILLTAKAGDDNIIQGYEMGADRYISKPFSLHVLEAQVTQLMATRKHLIDLYSKKIMLKPRDIAITSIDERFLSKLINIIEDNITNPDFDVSEMVEQMGMSHSAVLKKIKALTNNSLVDFVRRHRLNKAALIFQKEKLPVNEVAYLVGFADAKYFSKCFSKQFGKTPTDYLNEHINTNDKI